MPVPNGAGKTTLINIICGIVNPGTGHMLADGHDVVRDYRVASRYGGNGFVACVLILITARFFRLRDRPSFLDAVFSGAHSNNLQHALFHHRHLVDIQDGIPDQDLTAKKTAIHC